MNLQETIRRILREVRVPRNERVELYKDDNIIVVVPLTHRALQKYAHRCLWCINDDKGEWEDYHKGKHAVIIQRNPKKPKIGITGNPTASEIFLLAKWDNNQSSFEDVCQMLDYEFRNDRTMSDYYVTISNDINNFATNIVYYSPENGVYDQEDNFLWNFNIEINDIPNVKPKVIEIMDDYLQENEEMNLQESIRRILREELSLRVRRRIDPDEMEKEFLESFDSAYDLTKKRKVLSRHFLNELISTIIIMMMEAFHWRFDSTLPEDEFWYDDIHTELENHYRDRITQMYNEIRGINESIIREETKQIVTPIINESMGYSRSVEQWADYISDEFLSKILRQNSTFGSHVYTLSKLSKKLNDTSFYKELPIDNIVLNVSIDEVDDDDSSIDMEYLPYYTQIKENEDGTYRITDVKFNAVLTLPKDRESVNFGTIEYYFTSFLSHELMHLNEWVNRKLEYPKEVKDCGDVYSNGDIDGDAVDRIGYMIYVSQSYELNAFIQQAATLITKRNPKDQKEFMYYLDELPFYYIAETMIGFNKNTYMDEIKKLGKDRIDELAKMSLCFYDDKNKSLDKFLTDLDKRFKVRGEYLRKKLLRLVSLIK